MRELAEDRNVEDIIREETDLDYHALNAMLNLYDQDGRIQFERDKQAARQYFLQHVNNNTVFFHDLKEKLDYLVEKEYYEPEVRSVLLRLHRGAFEARLFG